MRATLAVLLALAASIAADSDGGRVQWEAGWTTARARAGEEGLPILLYFTIPG